MSSPQQPAFAAVTHAQAENQFVIAARQALSEGVNYLDLHALIDDAEAAEEQDALAEAGDRAFSAAYEEQA
jgi:hypothetical protein